MKMVGHEGSSSQLCGERNREKCVEISANGHQPFEESRGGRSACKIRSTLTHRLQPLWRGKKWRKPQDASHRCARKLETHVKQPVGSVEQHQQHCQKESVECARSVIAQRKKVSQCEHQGGAYQRNGESNKGGKAPNEENAEEGGEEMRFASDAHCKVAYDERKSPK